ncbi:MAG TPA: biosynthetic peptidoglycan transglycosylase [Streptosporangiaceae bacterium]|nr:biosynthetic peptidoglycan transglycosylase [Streptosporangiaceae bacterium]
MTARGPAWEGGPGDPGDPQAARLGYDPQTAPLPYGTTSGDPYGDYAAPYEDYDGGDSGYGGKDYPDEYEPGGRAAPRRRGWRLLRRLLVAFMVLVAACVATFGVLLVITPSVNNAPALARAIDQGHHVAYPGPPVPALFAESLVATEDHRFYSEPGVDVFAIARVITATITRRGDQGGATLYQQLAKMLYTPGGGGLSVEAEQVILGIKLDLTFSKPQILRMYSDVAYFGHGYYGLSAASCGYFGTAPAGLTLPEAATLAGLVQGPSADDPILHYTVGRAREAHVLGRLVSTGKITQAQAAAAYAQQLHLVGGSGTGCPGPG